MTKKIFVQERNSGSFILLRGIGKNFGNFKALKNIGIEVKKGEFIAIVGKSGSGKSTLMNVLTGIDKPTEGDVIINGTQINMLDERKLSLWRGKNVGVVFQFFQLLPTLTVMENVMLPMDFCNTFPAGMRRKRALEILMRVGIGDQGNKLPASLSGGQQQRAAIARALANDPFLIAADEPTGNLDSQTSVEILKLFKELADSGKTVIMVTHEHDIKQYATREIMLTDGELREENEAVRGKTEVHYA